MKLDRRSRTPKKLRGRALSPKELASVSGGFTTKIDWTGPGDEGPEES
jgi:hypothetical protein